MNDNILDGMSMDIEQANMDKLKSVFPECFAEGKLDIDKLLSLCGEYIDNDFEKYKFEWKGKAECLRLAQKRSTATLRPCPEESVHWDTTKNLYIEGDNLEVLKLLQTAYYRKVKMIYIDPPYNTGNDFVYEDNFADPLARYKEVTQQTTKSNPETMGRYHTNWLNMMYPRLRLAANLLKDDGVIFISIDDNEITNLRKICDEIFGEENFVAQFTWKRRSGANDAKNNVSLDHEYVLCYGKSNMTMLNGVIKEFQNYTNPDNDPRGEWARDNLTCGKTASQRPNLYYPIIDPMTGIEYKCNPDHVWRFEKSKMEKFILEGKVIFPNNGKGLPAYKRHKSEVRSETKPYSSIIDTRLNSVATKEVREILNGQVFDYPKTIDIMKQLIGQSTNFSKNDIILDFFSGSATTAHAVMRLNAEDGGNRQFIMVQLPEVCDEKSEAYQAGYQNICEIGKERIRRAGKKIKEEFQIASGTEKLGMDSAHFAEDIAQTGKTEVENLDIGFKVFKLDSSNLKTWDNTPVTAEQMNLLYERMHDMIHRVKSDRSDLDMVYEIMLKLGVPLTYSVTAIGINGKAAYAIGDDCLLLVCLAPNVQPEDIKQMAEFAPAKLIISRESFVDDTAMANAHYILKDHGVELKLV